MISDATFGDVPIVYPAITVFIACKFNDPKCWDGLFFSSEDVLPLGHHDKINLIFLSHQGINVGMKTPFKESLGLDAVRNGNTILQDFAVSTPILGKRGIVSIV